MKKFNMHIDSREEGELVDSFITSPALPASRTLQTIWYTNEMIRYRIIVGLRDSNLSERQQTYPELNLDIKRNNDGSMNRSC